MSVITPLSHCPLFALWACLVIRIEVSRHCRRDFYTALVFYPLRHMGIACGILRAPGSRASSSPWSRCSDALLCGSLVHFAPRRVLGWVPLLASFRFTSILRSWRLALLGRSLLWPLLILFALSWAWRRHMAWINIRAQSLLCPLWNTSGRSKHLWSRLMNLCPPTGRTSNLTLTKPILDIEYWTCLRTGSLSTSGVETPRCWVSTLIGSASTLCQPSYLTDTRWWRLTGQCHCMGLTRWFRL